MSTSVRLGLAGFNFHALAFRLLTCLALLGLVRPICVFGQATAQEEQALAQKHRLESLSKPKTATSGKTRAAAATTTTQSFSGGATEDDESFSVGSNGATVTLSWDMFSIPDRLELVLPGASTLFATGLVQGQGSQTISIPPGYSSFQVVMNRGGGLSGTAWNYTIVIAQGTTTDLSGLAGNPNQIKDNPDSHPDTQVSEPVDTSTGAHIIHRHLLALGGARPLTFDIDYNSLLGYNGPLGTGWSHNHQVQLQTLSNGTILLRWSNKRQNLFQPLSSAPNTFTSSDQVALFYTLTRNADGSFILLYKDQSTWSFDSAGRMASQTNPVGQKIVYAYTGANTAPATITEPVSGRSFSLTYTSGLLTQVADNTGRTAAFSYSADLTDRLVSITLAEGSVKQTYRYTYDSNGRVLTGATPEGVTVFRDSYDDQQRVKSQTDANGNTTTFAYDETSQPGKIVTTVTDRLGNKSIYVSNSNFHLLSLTDPLGHVTSYAYDQNGSRTSVTDPNGHVTQLAYDAGGNLISTADAAGNVSSVAYNVSNRPTAITNAAGLQETIAYDNSNRPAVTKDFQGNQTALAYDANSLLLTQTLPRGGKRQFAYTAGQPTQITDPDGNASKIEYDAKGRPAAITDAAGGRSVLGYDINDHLTSRTDPLGNIISAAYDSRGLKLSETDALGNATVFSYDGNRNLTNRKDALGNNTSYGYDKEDRLLGVRDANGNTTIFAYDAAGRLASTTDPLKNTISFSYDAAGNRTGVTDALGNQVASTAFDARNLPVTVQDALKRQTANTFDSLGRLSSRTDALQRTTAYAYDNNNRLAAVTNALNQTTAQAFDADGNLAGLTDGKQNNTGLAYDAAGRLVSLTTPSGATTSYAYDPRGLLTQLTEPSGQQSTSTYDAAGRKTKLEDGTGATTYTYDAAGRPLTTAREAQPITRTYDALGRLTKFTDYVGDSISYAYDAVGNQTDITYAPGLVVHYTYDADNRMTSVTDWNQHKTTYAYDANGRLVTTTRADGSVETRTYDAAGQLTEILDMAGTNVIYHSVRTFDAAGQVTSEVTTPKVKPPPFEQTVMTFDADNKLASFDGVPTLFDLDGNMTKGPLDGKPARKLIYNSRNQLTKADHISYLYDAENYRTGFIDKTGAVSGYIYDRSVPLSRMIARVNPDGSATRYIYGVGLVSDDEGGSYRIYHFDARGSTVALTDASANVIGKASYGPFGEITRRSKATADTPFLFNGRYGVVTDANGLYYMRARYYDPVIRRFVNQDPLLGALDDGGGLNRFAFANGNPVSLLDPFGLYAGIDDALFSLGGGVIGLIGQGISDVISNNPNNVKRSDYIAAFLGGAAGGEALLYTGPIGAGAIGGGVTNTLKQGFRLNDISDFSFKSLLFDTAVGAGLGAVKFFPLTEFNGITTGSNSYNAIFKQIVTKFESDQISDITFSTAEKIFLGRIIDTAAIQATISAGIIGGYDLETRLEALLKDIDNGFSDLDNLYNPNTSSTK